MRQQRKRVFLGCQGDSERSYGTLLHRLVHKTHNLHIEAVPLNPGAGDPLDTVRQAIKICRKNEAQYTRYAHKAILIDMDQMGLSPERDNQCVPLAEKNGLHLIWQRPCHEGLLLHHIAACQSQQPQTAREALAKLKRHWPEYEKGINADLLGKRISYRDVIKVCQCEAELKSFLEIIGFKPLEKAR